MARAKAAEPEVCLFARRIERERLHVATDGEVVFARRLVRVRFANELVGARRACVGREEQHTGADEEAREATCHRSEVSAIFEEMWPFTRKRVGRRFAVAGTGQPAEVEVLAKVSSPNVVTSPINGTRAALLRIEVVERLHAPDRDAPAERYSLLGTTVLGDVVTLVDEAGAELSIIAHRAHFPSSTPRAPAATLERLPPELAPLLKRATGRGVICYRELPLRQGDEVLVRAFIEATTAVIASGYRDAPTVRYVARSDLGVVEIEEAPLKTPF